LIEIEAFTLKHARKSALVVAAMLALLTAYQAYRGRTNGAAVLAVSAGVLLACAAIPAAAMFFHKWWMTLAHVLGYVNSRIVLGVVFFALITPIGLIARLAGHDPLDRRTKAAGSYWRRRQHTRQTREQYERAF
jgi:Saxitoxin biosynthesis operon protein SxtJ